MKGSHPASRALEATAVVLVTATLIVLASDGCASAPVRNEGPADAGVTAASHPDGGLDAEAWRQKRPPPGPPPVLTLPRFEQAQLPNGVSVFVNERRDLPLVSAVVAFAAGAAADPPGRAGTADLTYRLMVEGAGKRNALQVAEAFADLGVTPSVAVQPDGALIGAQVLSRNLDATLALLADIAQHPQLSAADFQRRREERRADLLAREVEPRVAAMRAFVAAVYGESHPYGHPSAGTVQSLSKLRHEDVRGFFRRYVGPRASALVLTGDISLAQAVALAKKYFGGWKGAALRPPPPPPAVPVARRVFFIARPGLEQTVVLLGRSAVRIGDPDEAPLELALAALGGSFGSRLNLKLREDKGYSYGTAAMLDARRSTGAWLATTAVETPATGAAMADIIQELRGTAEKPLTQSEIDAARGPLVLALPGSFETNESTALALTSLFFEEQPLDHYAHKAAALQGAGLDAVRSVVQRDVDFARLQIVLVGDPRVLKEQIPPLGLGPLQEVGQGP